MRREKEPPMRNAQARVTQELRRVWQGRARHQFVVERRAQRIVRRLLTTALAARERQGRRFAVQDFRDLVHLCIATASPRIQETLVRLGVPSDRAATLAHEAERFEERETREVSRIGDALRAIKSDRRMRDTPKLRAWLTTVRGLLARLVDLHGPRRRAEARERFDAAAERMPRVRFLTARTLCPLLYALNPHAFALVNGYVSEGLKRLTAHDVTDLGGYRRALEDLDAWLTRLKLPPHFGALDRLLAVWREEGRPSRFPDARNAARRAARKRGTLTESEMTFRTCRRELRKNQAEFRRVLLQQYGSRCAVTGWAPPDALEAAHIRVQPGLRDDSPGNGILLRADVHALFDEFLLSVHPDRRTVELSRTLRGTEYWRLRKRKLRARMDGSHPMRAFLQDHYGRFQEEEAKPARGR